MSKLQYVPLRVFKNKVKGGEAVKNALLRKAYNAHEIKQVGEEDSRTFRFTISTGAVDRDKDTVSPEGFNLDNYKNNPTVLFAHDSSAPPIGRAPHVEVKGQRVIADTEFMTMETDISGFSEMIYRMVKDGFLRAASIGFLPEVFEFAEDREKGGIDFIKQELLEFSIVPVPSNPEALIEARSKGIDTDPLAEWMEEALDNWEEKKDGLFIPRRKLEKAWNFARGKRDRHFHLSQNVQDTLLERNLAAVTTQKTQLEPPMPIVEFDEKETANVAVARIEPILAEKLRMAIVQSDPVLAETAIKEFIPADNVAIDSPTVVELEEAALNISVKKSLRNLPQIASKVFNTPLMVHEAKFHSILSVLGERIGLSDDIISVIFADEDIDGDIEADDSKPYQVTEAGVAIIPIMGTLSHGTKGSSPMSGMKNYSILESMFNEAMEDADVRAVMLHVNSPGGDASGVMDFSDTIYEARGIKPIWAIVDEACYSAAYAIASAADEIIVPRTGGVGSIGVVCLHADASVRDHEQGMRYTLMHAGEEKVDGSSFEPLSDRARAGMQKEIDELYDIFVKTMARNLGIDEAIIRKTEAATFGPKEAVELGLATRSMTVNKAFYKMESLAKNMILKQEENLQIQTLIFPKVHWKSEEEVTTWASNHDYKTDALEQTDGSYRLRQDDPSNYEDDSFRTFCISPNDESADSQDCTIKAVGAVLKVKEPEAEDGVTKSLASSQERMYSIIEEMGELRVEFKAPSVVGLAQMRKDYTDSLNETQLVPEDEGRQDEVLLEIVEPEEFPEETINPQELDAHVATIVTSVLTKELPKVIEKQIRLLTGKLD